MSKVARSRIGPSHVAITGASSGIGEQLALAYAAPGVQLSLGARRVEKLEIVAEACRNRGAKVSIAPLDVCDVTSIQEWYDQANTVQRIDLIIVNAGVFDGHGADNAWETVADSARIIDTNAKGSIHTAQIAMEAMRRDGGGHIALVSSLAAILPAADAPSYSASKAALVAYCDSIRMLLRPYSISVSVILPGHVRTAQTDVHIGPLAMILPAERAAATIKRGLDARRAHIAFPVAAHWLVRLGSLLPWRIKAVVTQADRFHVKKVP